jgi:xylose isomerase
MLDAEAPTKLVAEHYAGWAGAEGSAVLAGQRSSPISPTGRWRAGSIRSRDRAVRNIWNLLVNRYV